MLQRWPCLTGGSVNSFGVVRARYDFSARDRSELSLREGDTIKILSKKGHSGWWKGEVYGRVRNLQKQNKTKQKHLEFEASRLTCTAPVFPGGVISCKLCGGGLLWILLTWLQRRCVAPYFMCGGLCDAWFPSIALTHIHECGCVREILLLLIQWLSSDVNKTFVQLIWWMSASCMYNLLGPKLALKLYTYCTCDCWTSNFKTTV